MVFLESDSARLNQQETNGESAPIPVESVGEGFVENFNNSPGFIASNSKLELVYLGYNYLYNPILSDSIEGTTQSSILLPCR